MDRTGRILVICDGGLAAALACASASESAMLEEPDPQQRRRRRPVAWLAPCRDHTAVARRAAARRIAELYDLEWLDPRAGERNAPPERSVSPNSAATSAESPLAGEDHTSLLIESCYDAIRAGCSRVVWPIVSDHPQGPDLDAVSRAVDRAALLERVIALDSESHGVASLRIDVPYVDFFDQQLADLIIEMDVPIGLCWWWHAEQADRSSGVDDPTRAFRAERDRWLASLPMSNPAATGAHGVGDSG
jgi:hypothetical protein